MKSERIFKLLNLNEFSNASLYILIQSIPVKTNCISINWQKQMEDKISVIPTLHNFIEHQ